MGVTRFNKWNTPGLRNALVRYQTAFLTDIGNLCRMPGSVRYLVAANKWVYHCTVADRQRCGLWQDNETGA